MRDCVTSAFRLDESLGYLINRVAAKMRTALERGLAEHDVTAQQWAAMALLGERRDVSLMDIAARLGVDLGATSRLLSRLEQKELVARVRSATDGRVTLLALTLKGARLLPELRTSANRVNDAFRTAISDDEQQALVRILGKLLREDDRASSR